MNKMKQATVLLLILALAYQCMARFEYRGQIPFPKKPPAQGYVPDVKTAVGIANLVSCALYGDDRIKDQQPLMATLNKDIWEINGTIPKDTLGVCLLVRISRKDGRILVVTMQ